MMESNIAFLDILGFSNHVYSDLIGTKRILQDINELIAVNVLDGIDKGKISDENLYRDLENYTFDAIDFILPVSDCIFLGSKKLNSMIEQISTFLCRILEKTLHDFEINQYEGTFPIIMRGGISCGEIEKVNSSFYIDKEPRNFFNIIGKPVVEAVRLEEEIHGGGPNLFLTADTVTKLSKDLQKFVSTKHYTRNNIDTVNCFLWPRYFFIKENLENNFSSGFSSTCKKNLKPIIKLYFKYKNEKYAEYYKNLACITIEAFSKIYLLTSEERQQKNKKQSQEILKEIINEVISLPEREEFYRCIFE